MNRDMIFDAMDHIDDEILQTVDALRKKKKPRRLWRRWAAAAACLCAASVCVFIWSQLDITVGEADGNTGFTEMAGGQISDGDAGDADRSYVLRNQPSFRWYRSLEECMENSDFILTCTVEDVGESYTSKDSEIIGISGGEGELEYIRSIRTPVTLNVQDVYYDSTGSLGETLTITEKQGSVGKYTLESVFPAYEEGHEYLLFIAQAPDGETNIVIGQGSVELYRDERTGTAGYSYFVPMMNEEIYSPFSTVEEIEEAIHKYIDNKN